MEKYVYDQSPFYKCTTKRKLSYILRTDIKNIIKMISKIEQNSDAYKIYEDNSGRIITIPNKKLKIFQKRISKLLSRIEIPEWVHGDIKKRSTYTNVKEHVDSKVFLSLDVKSFYNNCNRERIYQYFYSKLEMSADIAKIMTDLTTYKNNLPTGSPSSSYLSFLTYEEMFTNINEYVTDENMIMTLYSDDITISGKEKITNLPGFISKIDKILKKSGHHLNINKTNYDIVENSPIITGISISPEGKMKVSNKQRFNIIKDIKRINDSENVKLIRSIKGRIATAQQIESNIFLNTSEILKNYNN